MEETKCRNQTSTSKKQQKDFIVSGLHQRISWLVIYYRFISRTKMGGIINSLRTTSDYIGGRVFNRGWKLLWSKQ